MSSYLALSFLGHSHLLQQSPVSVHAEDGVRADVIEVDITDAFLEQLEALGLVSIPFRAN